jgi:rSAM/selenodomain-associated transferase 1
MTAAPRHLPPARHAVIFARAPVPGAVKTRLARDIGRIEAWRFYRTTLAQLMRRLDRPGWTLWLAVSAAADRRHPIFAGRRLLVQPPGDLGARMAGVLRILPPGPAVIVGSDIPEIAPADLTEAFRALGRAEAVFGPAEDGGYWLAGLARRHPVPRGFMGGVRWSTPAALDDTLATLPKDWRAARLRVLDDIDDGLSWRAWRRRQQEKGTP